MSIEPSTIESLPAPSTNGAALPTSRRVRVTTAEHRPRYGKGWRKDKPVEDPEKTKRWGFVTAKPSEYLIHMRKGRILRRTSGQGATCFKWPWDSVAIVPTSIDRLQFAADQVTREKVGVEVLGLAVYRIVDPLLAYRMLNFSFTERASEKLEEILGEMFVGATRRLVANLNVEEVLTRRKDALASELMREIAPVVSGSGRPGDGTDQGWGVVIDTIEVQDVRVLSESVFTNMQAAFRAELSRRSREAELEAEKTIAMRETANERAIAEARIASDAETRELRARGEGRAAQIEMEERTKKEALESELRRTQQAAEIEHQERESLADAVRRRRRLALDRESGLADAELLEARKRIENTVSDDSIRMEMVRTALPEIGRAFAQKIGEVHLTSIGGGEGADPSTLVAGAIAQILEVARAAGITWGERKPDDG